MMNVIGMTNVFPLQNPLDVYYNYKQKREDRRMIELTAQKEKYAYRNNKMKALKAAQGVTVGPKVGDAPKVGEAPKVAGTSKGGLPAGQKTLDDFGLKKKPSL